MMTIMNQSFYKRIFNKGYLLNARISKSTSTHKQLSPTYVTIATSHRPGSNQQSGLWIESAANRCCPPQTVPTEWLACPKCFKLNWLDMYTRWRNNRRASVFHLGIPENWPLMFSVFLEPASQPATPPQHHQMSFNSRANNGLKGTMVCHKESFSPSLQPN